MWVQLDRLRFVQTLSNLLSNALKFTEAGSIDVHVRVLDTRKGPVRLSVQVRALLGRRPSPPPPSAGQQPLRPPLPTDAGPTASPAHKRLDGGYGGLCAVSPALEPASGCAAQCLAGKGVATWRDR